MHNLNRLSAALEEFRTHCPDASILTFQVFLEVAMNQGMPGIMINRMSGGASQSTINRHLLLLSSWNWQGKRAGVELIEQRKSQTDARNKLSFLTPKGAQVASALCRILNPRSTITTEHFLDREPPKEAGETAMKL